MKPALFTLVALLALVAAAKDIPITTALLRDYVTRFNERDIEHYTNAVPNSAAADFLLANCPRFACPDADVERTYYFRWWTFRKHIRKAPDGEWVITEFLPNVGWSGYGNTISCPFIHHVREGRWLADRQYMDSFIRTILTKGKPRSYAAPPAWGVLAYSEVSGNDAYGLDFMDALVANHEAWEKGWPIKGLSLRDTKSPASYEGRENKAGYRPERGLFDFTGHHEGSEFALSHDGARPMVNSMMWADAKAIAELARRKGDAALASLYTAKAFDLECNIKAKLWNLSRSFFTTLSIDGELDDVCELHGYAPFYFGLPLDRKYDAAFDALTDPKGFLAPLGLTFPRQDTPGFDRSFDYKRHECLWNGPSWPYATSVALTALYTRHHERANSDLSAAFMHLLRLYAAQHQRRRTLAEDGVDDVVPWIDENVDAFNGLWVAREVMLAWRREHWRRQNPYVERGKDYNHSTFCDLVISGLVGFQPDGKRGFAVDPLFPADWDYLVLENLNYRGHRVDIRWNRQLGQFAVSVDGVVKQSAAVPRRLSVAF